VPVLERVDDEGRGAGCGVAAGSEFDGLLRLHVHAEDVQCALRIDGAREGARPGPVERRRRRRELEASRGVRDPERAEVGAEAQATGQGAFGPDDGPGPGRDARAQHAAPLDIEHASHAKGRRDGLDAEHVDPIAAHHREPDGAIREPPGHRRVEARAEPDPARGAERCLPERLIEGIITEQVIQVGRAADTDQQTHAMAITRDLEREARRLPGSRRHLQQGDLVEPERSIRHLTPPR